MRRQLGGRPSAGVDRAYLRFTEEHRDAALFVHASAYSGYLASHAEEVHVAKTAMPAPVAEWMQPRTEAGEIAPISPSLVEVLLLGPAAEAARRWSAGTYDMDLGEAARVLPAVSGAPCGGKVPRNHVKAEATDKHPAQVEVYYRTCRSVTGPRSSSPERFPPAG
ncbi:hypothetical protein [Streptomyces wuyuanensis]|uniref:DUF7873 family protein n=1 Tax=Streptomyces wuyuanensis TaxID=1196353 RepID=UPI003D71A4AE